MLTLRECDKAVLHTKDDSLFYHKKISCIGIAAVVDRERCPQHDGVNDATPV